MLHLTLIISSILAILGGWDNGFRVLLILIVIDYITGIMSAYKQGVLCPNIGLMGIFTKICLLFLVAVSVQLDTFFNTNNIHVMLVYFLTFNEFISVLKNLNNFVPIPKFITGKLKGVEEVAYDDEGKKLW